MKTTKNKTVKGIKVLSNGSLYCALFLSTGCDWIKKKQAKITDIVYGQNAAKQPTGQNPIWSEIDEETSDTSIIDDDDLNEDGLVNPAFRNSSTDENDNLPDLSELPKPEAACEGQQETSTIAETGEVCVGQAKEATMPVIALIAHNKSEQNPAPVRGMHHDSPKPIHGLDQPQQNGNSNNEKNIRLNASKKIQSNNLANNSLLKNPQGESKNNMQEQPNSFSKRQNLPPKLVDLQKQINELQKLKTKASQLVNRSAKCSNYLNAAEEFLKDNNQKALNDIANVSEDIQNKYINGILPVIKEYIDKLTKHTNTKKSG